MVKYEMGLIYLLTNLKNCMNWIKNGLNTHEGLEVGFDQAWAIMDFVLHIFMNLLKMLLDLNDTAFDWALAQNCRFCPKYFFLLFWACIWNPMELRFIL